jgi:hypothetical protein
MRPLPVAGGAIGVELELERDQVARRGLAGQMALEGLVEAPDRRTSAGDRGSSA